MMPPPEMCEESLDQCLLSCEFNDCMTDTDGGSGEEYDYCLDSCMWDDKFCHDHCYESFFYCMDGQQGGTCDVYCDEWGCSEHCTFEPLDLAIDTDIMFVE